MTDHPQWTAHSELITAHHAGWTTDAATGLPASQQPVWVLAGTTDDQHAATMVGNSCSAAKGCDTMSLTQGDRDRTRRE